MTPGCYQVLCNGQILLEHCEYRTSLWFRFKGLMFSKGIAENYGILLKPCNSVHMFFMRYALDIVFLDADQRVLRICHSLKPWRVSPIVWQAKSVLECRAGWACKHAINSGMIVSFTPRVEGLTYD